MIQIPLILVGIYYAFKRYRFKRLAASDYGGIPADKFEQWRRLEIKSIDVFLWANWGTAAIFLVGYVIARCSGAPIPLVESNWPLALEVAVIYVPAALWLIGLVVSAVYGTKAGKLRRSLGI